MVAQKSPRRPPRTFHATAAPNAPAEVLSTTEPRATLASLAVDEEGREVIVLDLEGSRDQVSAKQLIARLSDEFGLSLDIPWNFIPEQLVLYFERSDTVSEALSVESKVAPLPLSCPKCGGLLPSGLGEINCTLCDARVR